MRAYTFHGKRNICGDRIRLARLEKRFSQSDLCRELQLIGIPMERDSISRIESGSRYVADYEVTTRGSFSAMPLPYRLSNPLCQLQAVEQGEFQGVCRDDHNPPDQ